ncbi:MAG: holo-ACP synthase [Nevskiales bacterium]
MSRIYGIGNDLLRVERMEKALSRHGERLPQRILHPCEQARYAASKRKANFLAKSFAVKEATVKALGLGFRGIGHSDVGWTQDPLGKPLLRLSDLGQSLFDERQICASHLTLTDEAGMVMAVVVLETEA